MTPTHTAVLIVTDELGGTTSARTILIRVLDTRIEDEQGRCYDLKMHGRQYGPSRLMPTSYKRRIDLNTLTPYVRPRVRL